MPFFLRTLLSFICLMCLAGVAPSAFAITVVIVSSERSAAYVEAADALVRELERNGLSRYEMLQLTAAEFPAAGPLAPKLFVALGSVAASALAKSATGVPVLSTLLPRSSYERILQLSGRKSSPQFSALYLDQPLSRQLDLIRLALPSARHLGVLWGMESQSQSATLKTLANGRGLELVEASVGHDESVFPRLKQVLEDADVLLAVADPQVYNSNSLQNILLASFRAQVPMVAFSPAYVRAGALLALHATPSQLGQQAGAMGWGMLQNKALPASPLYSRDFTVTVNEHVARSLGLALDGTALRERLLRREGGP
jgi:ABC-type uncharacterized transport system substrate-binding protein